MKAARATAHAEMLNAYTRIPRLQPDETARLIALAQAGNQRARNQLIEGNMRLVISIANKAAFAYRVPVEDLIAGGIMGGGATRSGLIRAIEKFDATRGACFSTYMVPWIRDGVARAALQFRGREELAPTCGAVEEIGTDGRTPFDELVDKRDTAALTKAVNQLPAPEQRLVTFIRDRRNSHLTNLRTACAALQVTKDGLRGLHTRSVATLRATLETCGHSA